MSNCKECVCEQVCKYNDGVNLWSKKDCPCFINKNYFAELTYKIGDTVFVVNRLSEIEKHTVAYFVIDKNGLNVGLVDSGEYTSDRVFASYDEAESLLKEREKAKKQLVKQTVKGLEYNGER